MTIRVTKLTVELVPKTAWFSNLRSHVDEATWNKLKKETALKANNKCEICGGRGPKWPVECHEIWNYNDEKHEQKLEGLIALCPSCHEVKHIGLASVKGRREKAEKHLAKVNGWTIEDARHYIEYSFEIWTRRSNHEWKLDLSWAEKQGVRIIKDKKDLNKQNLKIRF